MSHTNQKIEWRNWWFRLLISGVIGFFGWYGRGYLNDIKTQIRENELDAKQERREISQSVSNIQTSLRDYSSIDATLIARVSANEKQIDKICDDIDDIEDRIR